MAHENCQSVFLVVNANLMQFHEVSARLACHRQSPHNHHMLTILDKLIFLQAPLDRGYKILGRSHHLDAMRPDSPPERVKTTMACTLASSDSARAAWLTACACVSRLHWGCCAVRFPASVSSAIR